MTDPDILKRAREAVKKMTPEEKAALCSGMDEWRTEPFGRLGITSVRMTDGPHGLRFETEPPKGAMMPAGEPATCFPTAAALASSFDRRLVFEVAEAIGCEAAAKGADIVLGPGINIKRSPLGGRNFEYFSEDPYLSGELGAAWINGVKNGGAEASLKHFCANSCEDKRMLSDSCVDERTLNEIYLEGFRIAIEKGSPATVMTSYNRVRGEYVSESDRLMRTVLRERFGFDGVAVSDWGAVCDRAAALKSGLDLEMPGKCSGTTRDILLALKKGSLDEKTLDESAERLVALAIGCAERRAGGEFDADKHFALASRAAAQSAVLMKNDGGLLPFSEKERIAVVGAFAAEPRYQGTGSSRITPCRRDDLLAALGDLGVRYEYAAGCNPDGSTNDALTEEARRAVRSCKKAVLVLGLPDTYESEGFDRADMQLPEGMLKLADAVLSECEDTAVVLMLGSPVELPFAARAKSILCMYLAGEASGDATASLLFGKHSPSGRLAESWPKKLTDCASSRYFNKYKYLAEYREGPYIGYRWFDCSGTEPLFRFGAGLSYTSFEWGALRCDKTSIKENEGLALCLDVTNTGERPGADVVQIYIKKAGERYKQLRAFEKVFLLPGETCTVRLELGPDAFWGYDTQTGALRTDAGEYMVCASRDSGGLESAVKVNVASKLGELPARPDVKAAADMRDKEFFALLGYEPKQPVADDFTLNSPMSQLRRRFAGELVWNIIEANFISDGGAESDRATSLMVSRSLADMPIRAVCACSRGQLKKKLAKFIVQLCRHRFFKAVGALFEGDAT